MQLFEVSVRTDGMSRLNGRNQKEHGHALFTRYLPVAFLSKSKLVLASFFYKN